MPIRKPLILDSAGTHYAGKLAIHGPDMPVAPWISVGVAVLSQFKTQLSSWVMLLPHPLISDRSQSDPCKYQKVIRDDAAPYISFEALPTRPGAAVETEGSFQCGDARLDAGSEVPELLVDPTALGHIQDSEAAFLCKDGVLHVVLFCKGKIIF